MGMNLVEPGAALFADFGLLVYTGVRLGWWAPQSTAALNAAMGQCGRVEAMFLLGAISAILLWVWMAA